MLTSLSPIARRAALGLRFIEEPPAPEGGGGPAPTPTPAPAPTPPANDPPKTFTQADLDRIATREKAEGRAAAEKALVEQLGVTIDEAKAMVAAAKKADDATKTDAQKDREAAAREKTEAENEKAAARQEVHDARLERAFDKVGVDLSDDKAREKNLRLLRMVTVEVGASYEDVLADVKQIEKDFPGLFGKVEEKKTSRTPAPGGDPKGTPPPSNPGEGSFESGAKRARARYAGRTGSADGAPVNPLVAASQRG